MLDKPIGSCIPPNWKAFPFKTETFASSSGHKIQGI